MLGRGNFCAEKQQRDQVLPFGSRWSGDYASPSLYCIVKLAGK